MRDSALPDEMRMEIEEIGEIERGADLRKERVAEKEELFRS